MAFVSYALTGFLQLFFNIVSSIVSSFVLTYLVAVKTINIQLEHIMMYIVCPSLPIVIDEILIHLRSFNPFLGVSCDIKFSCPIYIVFYNGYVRIEEVAFSLRFFSVIMP